jgi:hypothetical protein
VAANHKWSKYGAGYGAGKHVHSGLVMANAPQAFQYHGLGTPWYSGTYRVDVRFDGHLWESVAIPAEESGEGPWSWVLTFPYAKDANWVTWLGSPGTKTLTLELVQVSTGNILATDTAQWTMTVPAITFTAPAASSSQPDRFTIGAEISDWYAGQGKVQWLEVEAGTIQGMLGLEGQTSNEWPFLGEQDGAVEIEADVDLAFVLTGAVSPKYHQAAEGPITICGWLYSNQTFVWGHAWEYPPGIIPPPPVVKDLAIEHVEQCSIEIASPLDGSTLPAASTPCTAVLLQGWHDGDIIQWSYYAGGLWHLTTSDVLGSGSGDPTRMRYANFVIAPGTTAIRVQWFYWDGTGMVVRCEAIISVTVSDEPPLPPPPPPPPGPHEPWLHIEQPTEAAGLYAQQNGDDWFVTIDLYVSYRYFTPGPARLTATWLRIDPAGSTVVTTYEVTLVADPAEEEEANRIGVYSETIQLQDPREGANYWTVIAELQQLPTGEVDTDLRHVTVWCVEFPGDEPPVVEIISPEDEAAVTAQIAVVAEVTDDIGVRFVQLFVDGQAQGRASTTAAGDGKWHFTWDSTIWPNGVHVLMVVAWDTSGQMGSDSIVVNLVNSRADRTGFWFTKTLGHDDEGALVTEESAGFRDADFKLAIETLEIGELPEDAGMRFNVLVGYNVPGVSRNFDNDYRLIRLHESHAVVPQGRTIAWGMKCVPQETLAYWEIAADELIKLAQAGDGDVLALALGPHAIHKLDRETGAVMAIADLSSLASAPVDMVVVDGKIIVAYADRLLVLDETTGDLAMEIVLPWPAEVSAISALAVSGIEVCVAAELVAGGSRLYRFAYPNPVAITDHDYPITALALLGNTIYAGNDQGHVLRLGATLLQVFDTEQDAVTSLGVNGDTPYAGTATEGIIYKDVAGWQVCGDWGWVTVKTLEAFRGWLYAGGLGEGGQYLWYEAGINSWVQTIALEATQGVNDLMGVGDADTEQLWAATVGMEGVSRLYRIEIAGDGDVVCGPRRPDLGFGIIRG